MRCGAFCSSSDSAESFWSLATTCRPYGEQTTGQLLSERPERGLPEEFVHCRSLLPTARVAEILVGAAEAFCEASMQACGTDARRDAIVVGRQLGVVLLEHVQPLGSPPYGVVSPAEFLSPLPPAERARARIDLVAALVEPLGEPYVAFVVLQVPVVALLEEPGRRVVPAASWRIVVRVRHLDSKPWRIVFGPRRCRVGLGCTLSPLLFVFYFRGPARIRRFLDIPVRPFRPPANRGLLTLLPSTSIPDHLGHLLAPLRFPLPANLQGVALPLHELEQERLPFLQKLQPSLGQVDVAARRLQKEDGHSKDRHACSQYGPDADIHQRYAHPCYLPLNAARDPGSRHLSKRVLNPTSERIASCPHWSTLFGASEAFHHK